MGYTHYWKFLSPQRGKSADAEKQYQKAVRDCAKVVRHYSDKYGGLAGYSAHVAPGIYGGLEFNGSRENGHEPFSVREHYNQNNPGCSSDFCKTANKPYDVVVVACLSILKHRLGDLIQIGSDGCAGNWQWGVELARQVTRLKIKNPLAE